RIAHADRSRPLGQDKERCLKRVFHILVVAKHLAAHHPYQPAMALDDLRKRLVIAVADESHQQLAIGGNDRARRAASPRCEHVSQSWSNVHYPRTAGNARFTGIVCSRSRSGRKKTKFSRIMPSLMLYIA